MDFGSKDIYIYFFPLSLFVNVYVYASLCDFVCIALLLTFVLGFCLSIFGYFGVCLFVCLFCFILIFFSIVFTASNHWWFCFLVWVLSSFFLPFFSFFNYSLIF